MADAGLAFETVFFALADDFAGFAVFFARVLTTGFFAAAIPAFGSSFLAANSNAGFGIARSCGPMRVSNAAGFTPAAAAAFAHART